MPIKLLDIELTNDLPHLTGLGDYTAVWALIRSQGVPVGYLQIQGPIDQITTNRLDAEIAGHCDPKLIKIRANAQPAAREYPFFSVLVCTRNKPTSLKATLDSLMSLDYPSYEVVVVDNCPNGNETADLVKQYPFRRVVEPRPGLNWARNRGLDEANADLVAYIDDDAVADSRWLKGLSIGFENADLSCVTGLILPSEIETPAQELWEAAYGGFGLGFEPRVTSSKDWKFRQYLPEIGSGCNMAIRKEAIIGVGKFDTALDGGTPLGGGGDIDAFHSLLRAGHTIAYRPEALVFHRHRRTYAELRSQAKCYSKAYPGLMMKWLISEPGSRLQVAQFAAVWLKAWFLRRLARKVRGVEKTPIDLIAWEALAALDGPYRYLVSATHARRLAKQIS